MIFVVNCSGRKNDRSHKIYEYLMEKVKCDWLCNYECMQSECIYKDDGVYDIYETMSQAELVIFIVPNYQDHPNALFYALKERSLTFE